MNRRVFGLLAVLFLSSAIPCVAQTTPAVAPSPSTGPAAFATFVGTWDGGGTTRDTRFSKAGTLQGHTVCRYSADQLFLICEQTATVDGTPMHDISIYSYDPERKRYRFQSVAPGFVNVTRLTIENNIWTYDDEETLNGKKMRYRTINEFPNPTIEQYRTEASDDDGATWTATGSGTIHRVAT